MDRDVPRRVRSREDGIRAVKASTRSITVGAVVVTAGLGLAIAHQTAGQAQPSTGSNARGGTSSDSGSSQPSTGGGLQAPSTVPQDGSGPPSVVSGGS
jgi:hypothetical protein